jgi:hypothetical protein
MAPNVMLSPERLLQAHQFFLFLPSEEITTEDSQLSFTF